jgi:hypothetical protein
VSSALSAAIDLSLTGSFKCLAPPLPTQKSLFDDNRNKTDYKQYKQYPQGNTHFFTPELESRDIHVIPPAEIYRLVRRPLCRRCT